MADDVSVAVHGASRLIADIVESIVGDLDGDGRPVAVLVDPVTAHWQAAGGRAVVVVLSDPSAGAVVAAVRRGADAVVAASAVLSDLPVAVSTVRTGNALLTPGQARAVVDALRANPDEDRVTLTRREIDIVNSILAGDIVKQTAIRLGIAPKTVENLQRRLFRKLDVRNRAQAVARVHELGLLEAAPGNRVGDPTRAGGVTQE